MRIGNSQSINYITKKCCIAKKKDITNNIKGIVDLPDGTYYILLRGNHIVSHFQIK